jgi:diguanylate cyclase (GGDEF)-like protein
MLMAIYDVLKFILGILLALLLAKVIPSDSSIGNLLNRSIQFSLLLFAFILCIVVAATLYLTLLYSRKKYKLLQQDHYSDDLTGLYNYKALQAILPTTIETCRKQNAQLSLIILDIDNFKAFNTNHGYNVADQVLAKVGLLLKSDNRATDILFRQYMKGDEFIILAKETELHKAVIAATRKKDLFITGIQINEHNYYLSVSCGVTEFNFTTDTQEKAMARLNQALQNAKSKPNKNTVEALI